MWSELRKCILNITDTEFCQDPFSGFINPQLFDKRIDFNGHCEKPMDLFTVRKKVRENSYHSVNEWIDDMNLSFDNIVTFFGSNTLFGGIGLFYKKKLKKQIEALNCKNAKNLEIRLIHLSKELFELISHPPSKLGVSTNIQALEIDKFSVPRLLALQKKLEGLVSERRENDIISIVQESDPSTLIEGTVDISTLSRKTLLKLEKLE